MRIVNLGIAQINPKVGDFKNNLSQIVSISKVLEKDAHFIIFPAFSLTGFPLRDLLLRKDFLDKTMESFQKIKDNSREINSVIVMSLPYFFDGMVYHSAVFLHKGEIIGKYFQRHFSTDFGLTEKIYFAKGEELPVFEMEGVRVGLCFYDDLKDLDKVRTFKVLGANAIFVLDAYPYSYGKYTHLLSFLKERAKETESYIVYTNMVGGQDEFVFDGRSIVLAPSSEIVARCKPFSEDTKIVSVSLNMSTHKFESELEDKGQKIFIKKLPIKLKEDVSFFGGNLEENLEEEAEIYEALKLALRDYFSKNGFEEVTVGISGGVDSSLVAVLAVDAIGRNKVKGLFMPTEFTSKESREDAYILSSNLGIELVEFPVTAIFNTYLREIRERFGWEDFTVAEENLQARIRANLLFYLSNRKLSLVLCTSNKSESATGYGTIYGDIAGGFAPLIDVYKTWVYRLARYRNSLSPVIPKRILEKAPSAELRPNQKDEDSLPPYDILDRILYFHLEEKLGMEELVEKGFNKELVQKVLSMLKLAEYKRRQAPIGPKITKGAFGIDYKIPVTSGFF